MKNSDFRENTRKSFFRKLRSKKVGIEEVHEFVKENNWLVSEVDSKGNTAIHYAALSGSMDKINYFLGERVNTVFSDEAYVKTIVTIKIPDSITLPDSLALNNSGHNAIHYFNSSDTSDFQYRKLPKKRTEEQTAAVVSIESDKESFRLPAVATSNSSAKKVDDGKIDDLKLPQIKR